MSATLFAGNAAVVFALMTVLWCVSVRLRDVSIIDPWWSIGSLLVLVRTVWQTGLTPGKALLTSIVAIWALRLFAHLFVRRLGHGEDPRYRAFRERFGARYWWISFFQVFVLQGVLVLLVSLPLFVAGSAATDDPVHWNDLLGAVIASLGVIIEATADAQLARFRRDPANKDRVMDRGLFGWSRHPNYFGEAVVAWGVWLMAIDQGALGVVSVLGPMVLTWLLLRVSGVTMLDAHMSKTKSGYAEYMERTPAFIPRWWRRGPSRQEGRNANVKRR